MNKKITQLRWLAATLMLVAAMLMPSVAWADTITPKKPTTGDGSANNPYQISNKEELYWFAGLVNGDASVCNYDATSNPTGTQQNKAACAKLMNDIVVNYDDDFSNHNWNSISRSNWFFWTPIGKQDINIYTGTFDGQGHTISGLYFESCSGYYDQNSKDYDNRNCDYLSFGLFGFNSGTIKNVGVINSYFGWQYNLIGGICGKNSGTIENCYNEGKVEGQGNDTGGICGENSGTIENCYNEGKVEGKGNNTGGICALNSGTITNCYNLGTVIGEYGTGGVCVDNFETIKNCYYLSGTAAGGIAGADDTPGSVEVKDATQFASGEVAWLLNGSKSESTEESQLVWYQNLSAEGGDIHPVLTKTNSNTVYQVRLLCGGVKAVGKTYANSNKDVTIAHELPETTSFNSEKTIYDKVCQRCGETIYYANAAGTIEATPDAEETEFTVTNYSLLDATTYDNKAVFTATNFTYTRTFSNANWTTWYVPFDLTLTQEICAKYDFSRINNVHQYDTDNDGTADKTVVESFRQMPGVTLKANYPYLVKPVSKSDLNMVLPLEGVIPALAQTNSIDCQSVDYKYTFTGTYTAIGEGGSNYYDPYTLWTDGTWQHFQSLAPMRHYLTVTQRNSSFASAASLRSIMLSVIGDEGTTGIVNMYSDERKAAETYDLGGRRLPAGASQKGVVIENGKVIIKK
ncbi:MAG: GLUG motif-containing protein [Prevotellaceae bacterium]|nr:GLUG motif-containing protein [Prevotellaceae bacterium]